MNFSDIARIMSDKYTNTGEMPTAIKVNKEWFERMLQGTFTLRKNGENPLTSFTGLPVQYDDNINTYEFVYRDEE